MAQKQQESKKVRPPQSQKRPGEESAMKPKPESAPKEPGSGKLEGKVALITGGDSGIGRAVAILFAREGADVAVVYLNEHLDAAETRKQVEAEGRRCLVIDGDVGDEAFAQQAVAACIAEYGRLDILVNNAAEQHPQPGLESITARQLQQTFRTNVFGYFYFAKAALPHLKAGSTIVNTTSVTAYRGSAELLDYSATKGAIVSFTRSLAHNLVEKKIRVNAVAPGPIWTPLIPSTFPAEEVAEFGSDVPMGRAGEPDEVAPAFLFLASKASSYFTGQVLHPNGGEVVNG